MPLDVVEVDRVAESRRLVEVAGVRPQHRVLGELGAVALEVAVVDGVEADQGGEQPDVGLGDGVADQVAAVRQPLGQLVEAAEHIAVGRLVLVLPGGETGAVHAVVDVAEDAVHDLVDLVAQRLRVQVGRALAVQCRPLGGEVQGDPLVVVGDQQTGGHVDDGRDADAARVAGLAGVVRLLEVTDAEHRVLAVRVEGEAPAHVVLDGVGHGEGQGRLQAEQAARDQRAARPGAGAADDEPVAAGLDRPAVRAVGRDAVGEVTRRPLEGLPAVLGVALVPAFGGRGAAGGAPGHVSRRVPGRVPCVCVRRPAHARVLTFVVPVAARLPVIARTRSFHARSHPLRGRSGARKFLPGARHGGVGR